VPAHTRREICLLLLSSFLEKSLELVGGDSAELVQASLVGLLEEFV